MPRLLVALVRHAAYAQPEGVPSAHLPYPLTPEARAAALALGDALAARERAGELAVAPAIACSTLRRAWETASALAERLAAGLGRPFELAPADALAERSLGAFANLRVDAIEAIVADDPRYPPLPPGWKADSRIRVPAIGAETLLEAGDRVARHIDAHLAAAPPPRGVDALHLVVGHGAALRHAAVHLGVLDLAEIPRLSMHHCRPVVLERLPGGAYRHVGGAWKVRRPGEAPHD